MVSYISRVSIAGEERRERGKKVVSWISKGAARTGGECIDRMAFAAARMILKDKRRKTSKEDFGGPRNRSKVISRRDFFFSFFFLLSFYNKVSAKKDFSKKDKIKVWASFATPLVAFLLSIFQCVEQFFFFFHTLDNNSKRSSAWISTYSGSNLGLCDEYLIRSKIERDERNVIHLLRSLAKF